MLGVVIAPSYRKRQHMSHLASPSDESLTIDPPRQPTTAKKFPRPQPESGQGSGTRQHLVQRGVPHGAAIERRPAAGTSRRTVGARPWGGPRDQPPHSALSIAQ